MPSLPARVERSVGCSRHRNGALARVHPCGQDRRMLTTYRSNFIGGTCVDSIEGRTDAVIDPATGEPMAEVASSDAADVDRAVDAAAAAFDDWAAAAPSARAGALLRFADAIEADADELVHIESRNVG